MSFTKSFISIVTIVASIHLSKAQQCTYQQLCNQEVLGQNYDFRGQSAVSKFSPGDTCKVQAIVYAGNNIRITTCSDPALGLVQFKVYRLIRDYKRIIDKIQTIEIQEPIYKTDKKGNPIPKLDDWGKPIKDFMGDIQFEIVSYKKKTTNDTIWKIERKTKEQILFDSRNGKNIFDIKPTNTEPIIIEMVIPPSNKTDKKKMCASVMIGRIFNSNTFKQFEKKQ